MPSFNRVVLMGHLTRDPQTKHLPNNTVVAEFGIAMNRKWRTQDGQDREEVCFVDCAAFGKQAETISQYCQKGKALMVEGRLKFDQWDDKNGGGKRSKLSVVVENFQFVGGRGDDAGGGDGEDPHQRSAPRSSSPASQQRTRPPQPSPGDISNGVQHFKEADIPF